MKYNYILFAFLITLNVCAQNFIKVSATHDFKKEKIVQTFSFDFNRTESMDEKKGSALLDYLGNYYYFLLPTSDINIGDGVTSSENNVLAQIVLGVSSLGQPQQTDNALVKHFYNYTFEANPSYNSDKLFEERLVYLQPKLYLNFISVKDASTGIFKEKVHSISGGIFSNIGYRFTKVYSSGDEYITCGVILDYKTRIADSAASDVWVFKVSGNYYYIASDIEALAKDDFGGIIKTSIDRRFYKNTYIGLSYKYGNDNPKYAYINTLEVSFKIKY